MHSGGSKMSHLSGIHVSNTEINQIIYIANTFCFEGNVSKKLDGTGSGISIKNKSSHHTKIFFELLKKLLVLNKRISTTSGKQGSIKENYFPRQWKYSLFIIMKNSNKILIHSDSSSKLFSMK